MVTYIGPFTYIHSAGKEFSAEYRVEKSDCLTHLILGVFDFEEGESLSSAKLDLILAVELRDSLNEWISERSY